MEGIASGIDSGAEGKPSCWAERIRRMAGAVAAAACLFPPISIATATEAHANTPNNNVYNGGETSITVCEGGKSIFSRVCRDPHVLEPGESFEGVGSVSVLGNHILYVYSFDKGSWKTYSPFGNCGNNHPKTIGSGSLPESTKRELFDGKLRQHNVKSIPCKGYPSPDKTGRKKNARETKRQTDKTPFTKWLREVLNGGNSDNPGKAHDGGRKKRQPTTTQGGWMKKLCDNPINARNWPCN